MSKRLHVTTAYKMVGCGQGRRVEAGSITADMSWLGEPPTDAQSARYERLRAGKHIAAIWPEIRQIEQLAVETAKTFTESQRHRARRNNELAQLTSRLATLCNCEICRRSS